MTNIVNVLSIPMIENDADAETLRDYLKELLHNLWDQGEGFSGKRPFGNSGWEYEIYLSLQAAGVVEGRLDEWGELRDFDFSKANQLVFDAIKAL